MTVHICEGVIKRYKRKRGVNAPCTIKTTTEYNGKWYCRAHHPEKLAKRKKIKYSYKKPDLPLCMSLTTGGNKCVNYGILKIDGKCFCKLHVEKPILSVDEALERKKQYNSERYTLNNEQVKEGGRKRHPDYYLKNRQRIISKFTDRTTIFGAKHAQKNHAYSKFKTSKVDVLTKKILAIQKAMWRSDLKKETLLFILKEIEEGRTYAAYRKYN